MDEAKWAQTVSTGEPACNRESHLSKYAFSMGVASKKTYPKGIPPGVLTESCTTFRNEFRTNSEKASTLPYHRTIASRIVSRSDPLAQAKVSNWKLPTLDKRTCLYAQICLKACTNGNKEPPKQAKAIHIHMVRPSVLVLMATKNQEATCRYTKSRHTMTSTKTGAMVTFPEGLSF